MYYAVIGLIRWTQDMLLFENLEFSQKKRNLRVVKILQIHSGKSYGYNDL